MTNSKNILSYLGLFALILAFLSVYYWRTDNYRSLKEGKHKTVGTIQTYGTNVICNYKIEGEIYQIKESEPFTGLQKDEMYEVYYDPNNRKNAVIIFENPILPDSVKFLKTKSIEINKSRINGRRFNFTYEVKGRIYERFQEYKQGEEVNSNEIYLVKYNSINPKIAYLFSEVAVPAASSL